MYFQCYFPTYKKNKQKSKKRCREPMISDKQERGEHHSKIPVIYAAIVNHIGYGAFEGCTALMQAIFEEPSKWLTVNYVLIDEATLSNRFSAAAALKTTYADKTWKRR